MDKLRIAVLGCGDIAVRSYLPMIVKLRDNVELAATCDIVPERAERASREFGAERSFADPETLVSKANVDGILVLTPMSSHGQLALLGLEAGKHVYVEKVMAPDLVTADRMIDLAEKQHLTLACAPSTLL
jgi:predicted dehydrogenase